MAKQLTLIDKADKLAKILEKVKSKTKPVGFTIDVIEFGEKQEVVVMCGLDFPDSIANKVYNACTKAGLTHKEFSCCADSSGGTILKKIYVNGGKSDRRWSRW